MNQRTRYVVTLLVTLAALACVLLSGTKFIKASDQDLDKLNRFVQTQNSAQASAKVFREGRDLIGDENWKGAADKFRGFITSYPKDQNVDAALYWLAFALKKQERYADADVQLNRLLKDFPRSKWMDDARSMRVEIAGYLGNQDSIDNVLDVDNVKDKDPKDLKDKANKDAKRQRESRVSEDEEIKIVALQSLCQSSPERCMAYVTNMFRAGANGSRHMKEAGLEMIRRYGGEQAVPLLIQIIRNETDSNLRGSAIHTLGRTGDERAFDVLVELVRNSTDDEVSKAAVFAISRFDGERAYRTLVEMARTAKSREVRKDAIFWLSNRGEAVLDELLTIFNNDQDTEIRKQIIFSLRRIGSPRAVAKLYEIASSHADVEVRKDAIHWIGQRGDAQAVDYLIKTYDVETNHEVKNQIIFALTRSSQKSALRKLLDIARNDKSVELRKQAVFWLGRSNDPEAQRFLEELLK